MHFHPVRSERKTCIFSSRGGVTKQEQQQAQMSQPQHKPARPRSAKQLPPARLTLRDITVQQPADASADADAPKLDALRLKEEEPVSDDEKAESSHESGVSACVIS